MLWASGNDWDREWIKQVVALLIRNGVFTLYPALSQCENAAERLTSWLTYQLPRVKQAHLGCPIHQWLNSIGAQEIVEKWQSPEQWPNLYWLPLPEVDARARRVGFVTSAFVTDICGWHNSNQYIASKHTRQRLYLLVHYAFV